MKRAFLIVIPLFMLVLLNACDSDRLPQFSPQQWAAIQATLQVTKMPQSLRIMNLMNQTLVFDRFSQLEATVVGTYDVTGVDFPYGTYFQVNLNCHCTDGSGCCDQRRMFLIAVWRISLSRDQILVDVPPTIQNLDVVCYNNTVPFSVVEAPWKTVKEFLIGEATAQQLSDSVTPRKIP